MKFRKDAVADPKSDSSREDIRDLAEALSLYRSAMQHIAEREAARPFVAEMRPARHFRLGLLLAPALAAAVAAGVFVPVYSHLHRSSSPVPRVVASNTADQRSTIDDAALMNQIDSDLSEDVPDAFRPLADLSDPAATPNSVSEKKNVTQE